MLSAVFSATHAEQGDRREMLSMPIQQMARCMIYHGGVGVLPADDGTMSEQDRALVNDFILDEAYRDYDPGIADPVKRHTNTYVVRYRSRKLPHRDWLPASMPHWQWMQDFYLPLMSPMRR